MESRNPRSLAPFGLLLAAYGVFLGFSLPHVFDPPIGTHGWRQAIATSMARLYAAGQPFLYPRAEGCGAEPGTYMGSEFPLYAWMMGKLGGAQGINFVGRVFGLLSALALMVAVFAIARYLFRRWSEPARTCGALAAGAFFAVSPLFRFYGISFVPDLEAHALALLGVALLAGPLTREPETWQPLSPARFLGAAVLIALGCLTKLIALPHLALAGLVLLERGRPRDDRAAFRTLRPWLLGLALVAIVAVPCWLWYVRWVPVLKAGGCDLVWLPEKMDDTWRFMTFTDAEWRFRMSKWGREDLLGPAWIACLAGVALAFLAGARGLVFGVWALGCAAGFVRLGWHTKQHDYDFLLVLPFFAVGFGAAVATAVRLGARIGERFDVRLPAQAARALPYAALLTVLVGLAPYAHRQSRRHFYSSVDEVGLEYALDRVLPREEPIHYFGGKNDPRIPYFARRQAWGTEPWIYCQQKEVRYDCVLATETHGHLAPCIERRPSVAWADRSLVCGIMHPESARAAERIVQTALKSIHAPQDRALPGVGRLLGTDVVGCGRTFVCAGNLKRKTFVDLYVIPDRDGPALELMHAGAPLKLDPDPRSWLAGTLMVARAELPDGPVGALEIRAGQETVAISDGAAAAP